MEVTGKVVKVVHRRKPYGSMFLTVTLAREGTHDIRLKYLSTFEREPVRGQTVTISGMPLAGYRDSNVSVAKVTVLQSS